jgi:signal transduction histidine kinase/CheY-like chemotaxis protein
MSTEHELKRRIAELEQENAALRQETETEAHSRLMAEEALGQTQDQLQLALDAAGLAAWQWDISSNVITSSLRFGDMQGLEADSANAQGQPCWAPPRLWAQVMPEDQVALKQSIVHALKTEGSFIESEFRIQTPMGVIWLECLGKVVQRDLFGRAERVIGINRNVSRRKTGELEIQAARQQAELANQAKDTFLAHVSHEIRTPLNGVIGMTNLIAQTELTKEQRQYVELVSSSGRSLLALVNDLLDYSRISAKGIVLEQVRFPLRKWLWEAVMPLQVSAQSKGLELLLEAAPELPLDMVGDPGRMRQIVSNLVGNAIKFTQRGHVKVMMRLGASPAELQIIVKDTGIGIAADKQATVFEAFIQADSSTSRRYGGTGLGLSICAQLAQAMNGRIELQSDQGQGSCFTVSLPMLQGHATGAIDSETEFVSTQLGGDSQVSIQSNGSDMQSAPKVSQMLTYEGKLALVADDHEINRLLARKYLERIGFEVLLAHDGAQALQAVVSRQMDVILMDIQMPQMNGWQATHEIRQWERDNQKTRVPIIALSAHASAADREQAGSMGMDGYLSKPLTPEALQAALSATGLAQTNLHAQKPTASTVQDINTAATPELEKIDRLRMLKRLGGDEAALHEVAQTMRRELRDMMASTYDALQKQDAKALRGQAHALKGALLGITADAAAEQAKALESVQSWQEGQDVFQRLSLQVKAVFDALRQW